MLDKWREFLDSIDSGGGHIFILTLLIVLGWVAMRLNLMDAHDIVAGAFGALLLALKSMDSNFEQRKIMNPVFQKLKDEDKEKEEDK